MGCSRASNELVVVVAGARIAGYREWEINIPGFIPKRVRVTRHPMSEWPKTQVVSLRRDAASPRVAYRVRFPEIKPPTSWEGATKQIKIIASNGSERGVTVLRPGDNVFYAPRGAPVYLSERYLGKLNFSRSVVDHETVLKPELPKYGFIELRYGAPGGVSGRPLNAVLVYVKRGQPTLGQMMYPGLKRFGPLPVGQARLVRRWADQVESSSEYRYVNVKEGLQVIEWK